LANLKCQNLLCMKQSGWCGDYGFGKYLDGIKA
jgi:hypothetical protein